MAPTVAYISVSICPSVIENASGMTIGVSIAHVPHEEPVRNEMTAQTMKVIVTRSAGVIQLSVMLSIYSGACSVLVILFTQYAIASMRIALITDLIPSIAVSIISFSVAILCIIMTMN